MSRRRCTAADLRTLRGTTVTVCLICDYADLLKTDDPVTTLRGPRLEFEPIPWPPRARARTEE